MNDETNGQQCPPASNDDGGSGRRPRKRGNRAAFAATGIALVACLAVGGTYLAVTRNITEPAKTEQETEDAAGKKDQDAQASTDTADTEGTENATTEAGEEAHVHDWTITYKTVHHDAVTHTETVEPRYEDQTTYHTVCNDCKQVIDGRADEHIRETGHSGYSTNVPITERVLVSEGYTKEVTDTPAYDETVPDKMVCTTCGATRPLDGAVQ